MDNTISYIMSDEERKQWAEFGIYEYEGMLSEEIFENQDFEYAPGDRCYLDQQEQVDEENWYRYATEGFYE